MDGRNISPMKLLKRVIITVVVLLLMKGLILLLDSYSPETIQFHRQFLFCMQLMVIGWIIILSILYLFKKGDSWFARFLPVVIVLVVLLMDMLFYRMLRNPRSIPDTAEVPFSTFYTGFERNILQYEPCMIYDTALFYKMIPGLRFTFGNIEYNNQYNINRESFRDDEASLFGPQVVCIGDSYTLGWGVDQDQTFAKLLSDKTSRTVLNGGNSSYGTARELKELTYVDTSILEHLVVQYCRNDYTENLNFVDNGGVLRISDEESYRLARIRYQWGKEYFPGKYFISIGYDWLRSELRYLWKGTRQADYITQNQEQAARVFLEVLRHANLSSRIKLIVIDLNGYVEMNSNFINGLKMVLKEPRYDDLRTRLTAVDLSGVLQKSDFYTLDTHLKASGHLKIADTLAAIINGNNSDTKIQSE